MSSAHAKNTLRRHLDDARKVMLWKLDGLSEYDVRRPLTAHGTNLLGLVKHLTGCQIGYFGFVFGRPFAEPPAWLTTANAEPTRDMWATPEESRDHIVDLYRRACAHSNTTIESLDLESQGEVPTWPAQQRSVTLHDILVHMLSETARHAGHADIVRELIDEAAGLRIDGDGLPHADPEYWSRLRARIESAAREAGIGG